MHSVFSLKEFTRASLTQDLPYSFLKTNLLKNSIMVIIADFRSQMSAFREAAQCIGFDLILLLVSLM